MQKNSIAALCFCTQLPSIYQRTMVFYKTKCNLQIGWKDPTLQILLFLQDICFSIGLLSISVLSLNTSYSSFESLMVLATDTVSVDLETHSTVLIVFSKYYQHFRDNFKHLHLVWFLKHSSRKFISAWLVDVNYMSTMLNTSANLLHY